MHERLVELGTARGDLAAARRALDGLAPWKDSEDQELSDAHVLARGLVAQAEGDAEAAQGALERLAREGAINYGNGENFRSAWPAAMDATLELGRLDTADDLLDLLEQIPPGIIAPYLRAQLSRGRARVAVARGQHDAAERHFQAAVATFGLLGYPYWLAVAEVDFAQWLGGQGRPAEAGELLEQAIAVLAPLRAEPALRRARDLAAGSGLVPAS
jgi:tetratricopeptide (TPR) repeat protein